jgi:hypothetical protein
VAGFRHVELCCVELDDRTTARIVICNHLRVTVPTELGGCKVLGTARVGPDSARSWSAQRVVGESADRPIRYLAIAQADNHGPSSWLFWCDQHWNVIWDDLYTSIQEAVAQARCEFDDVRFADLDELS